MRDDNDERVATLLAAHVADSLELLAGAYEDAALDDVVERVDGDDPLLVAMADGLTAAAVTSRVFNDPRVKKVLLDMVGSMVDAATYMRY